MNTIIIPSSLEGFQNTNSEYVVNSDNKLILLIEGDLYTEEEFICPKCGCKMHSHDVYDTHLRHLPFGKEPTIISVKKRRYECPECNKKVMQKVPFQAAGYRITEQLKTYIMDLLALGLTNKLVSEFSGVGKNTVKKIDKERLEELYCDGNGGWKVPEDIPHAIGIDEFKLHNGHKYATQIMDMEKGHVLYLAEGKKKQVVYDFIDLVGLDWMNGVEVVCCDMNSDFQEAFEEKCPHIQCIYDYFHIKKNFNDKVISEIRKEEQRRLEKEGKKEEAKSLKGSKYILTSSRSTLIEKDEKNGTALLERYESILKENQLLFTADLVKEKLSYAYSLRDEVLMTNEISEIMDICQETNNKHFLWFKRLLDNHFEGIISHASYGLSSGKVEGTNGMIKTLRRQAYGLPDDKYFFLKVMDASRRDYVRNPKSPKL